MSEGLEENNLEILDATITPPNSALASENIEKELQTVEEGKVAEKKPLIEPLKTSRFFLIRVLYHILRSIWIVAMIIGGLIAWIISLLFI